MRPRPPLPILATLLALHLAVAAWPAGSSAADRALYRIDPAKRDVVDRFLSRGVDVAGTGRDGTLHVLLDEGEAAAARALGLALRPLDMGGRAPLAAPGAPLAPPNLGDYHTLAETMAELAAYAAAHPTLARLDTLGTSVESRPIVAMKISDHVDLDESEPEALVIGCHHARELMSVELPLYLMRRLLDGYGLDPVVTALVETREIWIVPILNPDGHEHVRQNSGGQPSSWWRKNRRPNFDGTIGVDLNRNYGYRWGWDNFGSSPTPASETYRGSGPFSEPETDAIRAFAAGRAFTVAVSFHSYGELFLYPWGYDRLDTPDHAVFHALGDSVAAQNGYRAGNPKSGAIYVTNGDLDDWSYGETSAKPRIFGFTFELNSLADGGFYPSDALIPATCALNWGPMLTLLRYADEPRRAVPPARPSTPSFVAQGPGVLLSWAASVPDPANPPARHDVRRVSQALRVTDDAEAGVSDWDSLAFSWSAARSASGARSYWSGSGDNRVSTLASRASVNVAAGESLVVIAWWALEDFYDYWYAEASPDDGATWTPLPGDRTTNEDPFGHNEGNGITAGSGGFLRAAFSLAPFAGKQALVRFRCVTDQSTHGEGLYLDDIAPTGRYVDASVTDTGSPGMETLYAPPPTEPGEYQVRAVDGEGHRGGWSDRAPYAPGVTAADDAAPAPPAVIGAALAVAPNPFNPAATVRFRIGAGDAGPYRLRLYDLSGRLAGTIAEGDDDGSGRERVLRWEARDGAGRALGSGVYLLRLETVRGAVSRKITLLR
ncbi:MAG TPA: M14 family zinc carboxypeptidase [Acidobacteriota bacterium]|nr:M14 family zinc carboxypeptidase [Acidobacteriota bacterium]